VVVTSFPLIKPEDFRAIARVRHTELWWAFAALAGVVFLGTLDGILVAVAISVGTLFYQANHPPLYALGRKPGTSIFQPLTGEHPEDETIPGLLILRTEGRLNFASAPRLREGTWALIDEAKPRVLLVDCSAIPDFEYTALQTMMGFEEKLGERGIDLWLAALNPEALRVVRRSPLGEALGGERMFHNLEEAVSAFGERGPRLAEAGRAAPPRDSEGVEP
jgi:MFS superfamily sulfate permease-like transporter